MDISGLDELDLRELRFNDTGGDNILTINDDTSDNAVIESKVSDKDLIMKVNDGGSSTEVLRLQGADPAIQFFGVAGFLLKMMTITYDGRNGFSSHTDTSGADTTAKFVPTYVNVNVTTATVNSVSIIDIGTATDADCFVDNASLPLGTSTGEKGMLVCNGVFGAFNISSTDYAVNNTTDGLAVRLTGDPGSNWQGVFTFLGFLSGSA